MPRLLNGDHGHAPQPIPPRTATLREGIEQTPPQGYFIAEEEISRSAERITRRWQRTRWADGSVFVWLAIDRGSGRGGGSSGLAFDRMSSSAPIQKTSLQPE